MGAIGANIQGTLPPTAQAQSGGSVALPAPRLPSHAAALGLTADQAKLIDEPVQVDLVEGSTAETTLISGIGANFGIAVGTSNRRLDARQELARVNAPVDDSAPRKLGDRIDELRSLAKDPRLGPATRLYVKNKIRGLELLQQMLKRQVEKQLLAKKLLKQLAMGVLTPELLRLAKELGLVRFLKEAITEMIKRGSITPQAAAAMGAALAGAGIQMPLLDDVIFRHKKAELGDINAARMARGDEPIGANGLAQAGAGAGALSASAAPEANT